MNGIIKAAAYCRVSTDTKDQINSLDSQKKYFTDYINNHDNWIIKDIYYDNGISGTSTKRRESFNRMINDAINGEVDIILTKEVSRFARNTVDTLSYTRKLKDKGVGVIFINDNIDTREPDGELRLSIMATIAQEESRKTSERVKWGQKRRMEQGIVFGRDLLGYKVEKGQMTINYDEAQIVKLIYYKFLYEGKGTHIIARELYEAGIRPKCVIEWSNTVILRVLRNEKYVGDLCQKKTYTPNYLTHEKKYNNGNEETVYLRDHHEAIIDRDTWNKTQAELKKRSPTDEQKSKYSNRYWCSGKLVCGECGQRFVSRSKKLSGGNIYRSWKCYNSVLHGQKKINEFGNNIGCMNGSVNDKVLLQAVSYCIKLFKFNAKDIKMNMLKEIQKVQCVYANENANDLYKKIKEINNKKLKAVELVLDGIITKSYLQEQIKYFDEKVNNILSQIESIKNRNSVYKKEKSIEDYDKEIDRIMKFSTDNKAIFRAIVKKIIILNDKKLVVYLNNISFGIVLGYSSSGRGEKYIAKCSFKGATNEIIK